MFPILCLLLADRGLDAVLRSTDTMAVTSTTGLKFGDVFYALDRVATQTAQKAFFNSKTGKRIYGSVLVSDAVDASLVIVFVHGGYFSFSDQYDVSPWVVSLAETLNVPLVSINKALNRQSGWTLESAREHIEATVNATRVAFGSAKILLIGSSAGGTLALDVASRDVVGVDAIIAESPNICMTSLAEDIRVSDDICWQDKDVDPSRLDFVISPLQDLCFNNVSSSIPLLMVHPARDIIIPSVQFERFEEAHPPEMTCKSTNGIHANSINAVDCLSRVQDFLQDNLGIELKTMEFILKHGSYNFRDAFSAWYSNTMSLSTACRQTCFNYIWDPIIRASSKCDNVKEIVA